MCYTLAGAWPRKIWEEGNMEAEKRDLPTIQAIIVRAGGQTAFAHLHDIPLRTVQDWAGGRRKPPDWLVKILDKMTV